MPDVERPRSVAAELCLQASTAEARTRSPRVRFVRYRTAPKSGSVYFSIMTEDRELERLLKAERLAFERYDRLRGYPGDVQKVALEL
jgi:hypothetical protein